MNLRSCVLALLRGYKWALSPLLPPACRYVPTCSDYAMEAVDRYGVLRGGLMAMWRVLRCHPFVKGGYDPVKIAAAKPVMKFSAVNFEECGVTPSAAPPGSCAVTE
jgi:putative membrane protein insertion efficiency factor